MQKQQPVGVAAKAGKFNKYPKIEGAQPDAKTSRPNKFAPKKAEGTAVEKKITKKQADRISILKEKRHYLMQKVPNQINPR